ncbi:permease-like cell division protein FtsX [Nonomuraea sp. MTCD27]|uniref:permease-like cell division protein FtsX n=1 Tax=Nonomuraea sp. MTCD27 TaxID=1676747 RepID=UPI0035BFBA12
MNSPVEDRLREALVEAGATVDIGTLRPLRVPERRRSRVDFRLVTVAVAVVLAGAATAVVLRGGPGAEDRAVAADPPAQSGGTEMTVFLCTKSAPKESPCQGRAASREQVSAIERALHQSQQVDSVFFVDQATAYENFKKTFAHNTSLTGEIKVTDLPAAFRLKTRHDGDRRQVKESLRGLGGIQHVADQAESDVRPQTEAGRSWQISVFLCSKGASLPSCGGESVNGKNGEPVVTKEGKGATVAQKTAIQKLIESMPGVEEVLFEDQASAFKNFQQAFEDNEALIKATKVEDMPERFRIRLTAAFDGQDLVSELKRQPGVAQVLYQPCTDDRLALADNFGLLLPDSKVCPAGK